MSNRKFKDKNEGVIYTLGQYVATNTTAFTPSAYKRFLQKNFGPAASMVEKYYNLSSFGTSPLEIAAAITTVITDADYKCLGYEGLVQSARKNIPTWTYEYSHNNTCAWLSSLSVIPRKMMSIAGAAHTAEIPFVFGTLDNQPLPNGTCNATAEEYELSQEMMSLWTAMAENANPSTDSIAWPRFTATKNFTTPGLIFEDSARSGTIDYSACELWSEVYKMLGSSNSTTATSSPTASPSPNGAGALHGTRGFLGLSVLLIGVAVSV